METKVQVEMTAEQAEAFKQFQEKQAKEEAAKKRKEDREAYAQLVDSEVEAAIPELRSLSEQMLAVKRKVYENFGEVINIKSNVLKMTGKAGRNLQKESETVANLSEMTCLLQMLNF